MKKKISLKSNFFTVFSFIFHGGIILAFLISLLFSKGIKIDADLFNMLPSNSNSKASKIADENITSTSGQTVFILASHENFDDAKNAAVVVYEELKKHGEKFNSLNLYSDAETVSEIQDFIHQWRFNLLNDEVQQEILNNPVDFSYDALTKIYSGFSITGLDNLEEDPFLFDERNLSNYLAAISDSGTSMQPKDGVLATKFQDRWYVMIRGELSEEGAKLASKENAVPLIYEICLPLEKDGVKFVFNGTNFHSHKSSTSAVNEISVISTITLATVAIMLILIFRNGIPLVFSVFSIFLSLMVAFCATHAVFGSMHVITLVFGTSLIGSSIDYSLHYFINWKGNRELSSSDKIRRHLLNGLLLSLVSTEICYALLTFAPFTMLKQMAVFSFVGILSSFLTATGIFPLLKMPADSKREIKILNQMEKNGFLEKLNHVTDRLHFVFPLILFIVAALVLGIKHKSVKIQNDLQNLYKMEGRLKDDTFLAYQVLNYNPTSWLIISGDTEEEVLQLEEKIAPRVPDSYICTSRFVPSVASQKKSIEAAEKLVEISAEQFENLGFDPESSEDFKSDFVSSKEKFLTVNDELPETLRSLVKLIWIGKVEDKYYSLILPAAVNDETVYKEIAAEFGDNVYFENRIRDISEGLDHLTRIILLMFAIAYVIIFIVMKFFYTWRETLKIASIPLLSVMVICSVFVIFGVRIEFFCITGMILVFGLGLDYIIYKMENKESRLESFAITVSFLTTAISFGALALSSFVPVHVLGLSIFSGLVTAFLCTVL